MRTSYAETSKPLQGRICHLHDNRAEASDQYDPTPGHLAASKLAIVPLALAMSVMLPFGSVLDSVRPRLSTLYDVRETPASSDGAVPRRSRRSGMRRCRLVRLDVGDITRHVSERLHRLRRCDGACRRVNRSGSPNYPTAPCGAMPLRVIAIPGRGL